MAHWLIRVGLQVFDSRGEALDSEGTWHLPKRKNAVKQNLEIPSRYFSIARCYRPEVTDKTHLSEFNQVEGIVVDEN